MEASENGLEREAMQGPRRLLHDTVKEPAEPQQGEGADKGSDEEAGARGRSDQLDTEGEGRFQGDSSFRPEGRVRPLVRPERRWRVGRRKWLFQFGDLWVFQETRLRRQPNQGESGR